MSLPTLLLEAGFGNSPGTTALLFGDSTRGKFGTGTFGGNSYTDLSALGRSFTTSRGRARALDTYQAGRASIVFSDPDDDLNPANLSGAYVTAGATEVKPMAAVRIRTLVGGTIYPIIQVFADSWTNQYPGMGFDSTSTVQGTDGFKVLGAFEPPGPQNLTGIGELSGARLGRVLDNAGWSAVDRDLDAGRHVLQGTPLSDNALSECQGVEQTEQGYFFISADGKATFRDSWSRITGTRSSNVQAAFGNTGSLISYSDITLAHDDLLIKNTVSGQVLGGVTQTAVSSASVGSYTTKSYNATGLWFQTDLEALNWCQWVTAQYTSPELRIESITLRPNLSDSTLATVLGLEIGDLVTVAHTTPEGFQINRSLFVEGVAHTVTASPMSWETKLSFSSAAILQSGGWLVFGDSTRGKFGTGAFAA